MHFTPRLLCAGTLMLAVATTNACNKTDTTTKTDSTTVAGAPPATPANADEHFSATMDGQSERPNPVTTGATGSADITLGSNGSINYTLTVNGLSSNPTAAHIHGPADPNSAAGPIVTFDSLAKTMSGTLASGTIDSTKVQGISFDSLKTLVRNGMTYVNVHTANHKDGEIRGQLTKR